MALINLVNPKNVASGIGQVLFLAPVSYFTTLQKPEPPFLYPGASVTIFDDHIFLPNKNFLQFVLAPDKNDFTAKTYGDLGSQQLDQTIKCILPGSYAEQHELVKNLLNEPIIALVKDANCPANLYYQLGNSCNPAYFSADFTTGTTKDGMKGYSCTVNALATPINLYAGIIQLDVAAGIILQTEDGNILITEDGQPLDT